MFLQFLSCNEWHEGNSWKPKKESLGPTWHRFLGKACTFELRPKGWENTNYLRVETRMVKAVASAKIPGKNIFGLFQCG